MGRYIDDILQPGEKVLYSTNAHWVFYLPAMGAWIVAADLVRLCRGLDHVDRHILLCLVGVGGGGDRGRCTGPRRPGSAAGPPKPT